MDAVLGNRRVQEIGHNVWVVVATGPVQTGPASLNPAAEVTHKWWRGIRSTGGKWVHTSSVASRCTIDLSTRNITRCTCPYAAATISGVLPSACTHPQIYITTVEIERERERESHRATKANDEKTENEETHMACMLSVNAFSALKQILHHLHTDEAHAHQ